jgi:hypothetical protein
MPRFLIHSRVQLLLLVAAVICSGCSFSGRAIYIDEGKKTAERAIEQLHARLNAEEYGAIYDSAHEGLKSAGEKEVMIRSMKSTRDRMGRILQIINHWVNYVKGDPIPVRAIYNLKCEKGDFSEEIAYAMGPHGEALLVEYQSYPGSSPAPKD